MHAHVVVPVVAAWLIVAADLIDLSDATVSASSSGRTKTKKTNSSAETKLNRDQIGYYHIGDQFGDHILLEQQQHDNEFRTIQRETSEATPDLRDALEWMVGLWECTETVIYDGGVQHRFYSRLVCGSGNGGLLEIGIFDDEDCTARNTELDYNEVINLHNTDAIYYYSMLSEMGLLSKHIDTIQVTTKAAVEEVSDPTEEALYWLQLYRECEALDWYYSPKYYTQLVCNTEGTGLEIGFFLDEHCTVYTPMDTFQDFLNDRASDFMDCNNDRADDFMDCNIIKYNPEPNRTHYTILSEAGLLVTNDNAGQEFENATYWMEELWNCTDTNATLGEQRRIYSQLRCKADRSGGIEIALFSDDHCTQREPKLAFEDVLPYQTPTIATYYDQISRYPYLLKTYSAFDCSTWQDSTWQNETEYIDQERYMRAVARTTGVSVTIEDPRVQTLFFPRHTGKTCDDFFAYGEVDEDASCPKGDSFSDWMLQRGDLVDYTDEDWCNLVDKLYDGNRTILESLLREHWDLLAKDINQIPETAKWSIQRVEGDLMPILQDENFIYLLGPTSAQAVSRIGELTMPTPFQARIPIEGISPWYMNEDVWFEDCGDGGAYVIGLDDKVVLFYVDSPADSVMNRWQCDTDQWERMWISAFGATTVSIETVESAENLTVEFKISDDGSDEDSGADSSKVNNLSLVLLMVFVTSLLTN